MEKYVPNNLQINEQILIEPKLHWIVYVGVCFSFAVFYILFCEAMAFFINFNRTFTDIFQIAERVIALLLLLRLVYVLIRKSSIEMAITNYRVVFKIGIFHITSEELGNGKIESVSVSQPLMGRLLNYGDLLFSGTGTSKLVYRKVFAPWWVKSQVEDIIRQSYAQSFSYRQKPINEDISYPTHFDY